MTCAGALVRRSGYRADKIRVSGKNKDKTLCPCGTGALSYLFGYVARFIQRIS